MSKFSDILGAVKSALATAGVPVVVRKRAVFLEGDKLPLIVVSPGRETVSIETFGGIVNYDYAVNVTMVQAGNRIHEPDVVAWLDLRENVRNALYRVTLAGVANVFDTMMETSPALEVVSGSVNNYDVSGMTMTYRSLEARAS